MSSVRVALCSAHPFPPQLVGGAQRSMQQLAEMLTSIGYEVGFFVGLSGGSSPATRARIHFKLTRSSVFCDRTDNIKTFRSWFPQNSAAEFVRKFKPDIAICLSGFPVPLATALRKSGVPTIIYFRNVELDDFGGDPSDAADGFISNSQFTAQFVKERFDISSTTIEPYVDPEKYRTTPGDKVLFINPRAEKGKSIAFELVRRLPDIPFLIVRAWTLNDEDESELEALQRDCPNVTLMEPASDMREIYGQAKILLAPSQWDEAWGRVATEAHFSGIPVLASDAGGLPEAVGPGGVVLKRTAPIEDWCEVLRKLWFDDDEYEQRSLSAVSFSKRSSIQKDNIMARLDGEIRRLVSR
ncbi:glycosyltransferase involved in cell wall biosynthesis [Altererythrobacter atlanticus]|uniref:D-inositol 3-phosphate glycosyltransferase n=1 Tax=Croceibacterium atlanticum TaxID=1267766 RepID=A0A0F7KX62_9SPHN|nr:glycosyltransferase [Croceibacterium atlanticum]AKH43791.1 D-inositol 3-phosphate glycosyltransferase [Croceibacterium atlanticum]MBB5733759.1 glycosyltransferase involved in cell wall biosynthesis [Croceibacterium atlanticum]